MHIVHTVINIILLVPCLGIGLPTFGSEILNRYSPNYWDIILGVVFSKLVRKNIYFDIFGNVLPRIGTRSE